MPKSTRYTVLLCLAAACAPPPAARAPEPMAPPGAGADTLPPRLLRAVPETHAFRAAVEGGTRTRTGEPGPRYWQQSVSYRIEAELDPETAELRGRERIVYRNHSPEALGSIVLNLYQNVFTETAPRNRASPNTGGVTLERVAAQGITLSEVPAARVGVMTPLASPEVGYAVQGTLARVVLPRPVGPGAAVELEVAWRHRVPPAGTYRTAWEDTLGGRAFNVAQWYPQVAVFDDLHGWDATPYLGDGEFYLEYGDFDVSITVPAGFLVGATGTLQNPAQVLSEQTRARLARVLETDSVVRVVTERDLASGTATARGAGGRLTWRFRADSVRDFAFAASGRYLWDATRARIPAGEGGERAAVVHALYRPGALHWQEAARYGQHAVTFFSRGLIPYLYPQVTIAEGPIGGMEYPMLVFIGKPRVAASLYAVIAHEVGHEWFPMMVGQDEAAYAWMDEGLTTYFEDEAASAFFRGIDAHALTRAAYLRVAGSDTEVPLMRHTDLVSPYGARGVAAYSKPGTLMLALRGVVGDSVFARAMRTYAREWLLKHPTPWDFFNTVERVAGRDLDWFFYPWWFETGVLDHAIAAVAREAGGVTVTVRDLGQVPAPTWVVATSDSGAQTSVEIPVERWLERGARMVTVALPVSGNVVRVELDPAQRFPDVDRTNNVWTP